MTSQETDPSSKLYTVTYPSQGNRMKLKLTKTQKGTQTKNTKENTLKGKIIYKVQNNGGTQVTQSDIKAIASKWIGCLPFCLLL